MPTTYIVDGYEFELRHYGVKGMKWGVRRNRNSVNKGYSAKQRKQDRAFYGAGGAGTRAVKNAIKAVGIMAVSAYTKARGGYDIHWHDKNGRKIV